MTLLAAEFVTFAPAVGIWLITLLACAATWATIHGATARTVPWKLIALRLTALAGATMLLASPGTWTSSTRPAERTLDVVIDGSASMSLCDNPAAPGVTRLERAGGTWLARDTIAAMSEHHAAPTLWRIDERTSRLTPAQAAALEPAGTATSLWSGLLEVAVERGSKPAAPRDLILITDGRDTSGPPPADLAERLRASGVRLFTVPVGGEEVAPTLRLTADPPPGLAHSGQPSPIRISLRSTSLAGLAANLIITDVGTGAEAARQTITLADTWQGDVAVTPLLAPEERGGVAARLYKVHIEIPGRSAARSDRWESLAALQVTDALARVLMLEGSPGWQSRFLARAITSDPRFELTAVSAIALPERPGVQPTIRVTSSEPSTQGSNITISDQFDRAGGTLGSFDAIILGSNIGAILDDSGQDQLIRRAHEGGAVLLQHPMELSGPRVAPLAEHAAWPGRLLDADESRAWFAASSAAVYELALGSALPDLADVILVADRSISSRGEPVEIIARFTGDEAEADLSQWSLTIASGDAPGRLALHEAARAASGQRCLTATHSPSTDGPLRFELRDASGELRGSCIVVVRTPAPELDDPSPDHAALAQLAEATGGRVLDPTDHTSFLSQRAAEQTAATTPPIFRALLLSPWVFGMLGCLFIAEWIARRRRGLP